MATKGWYRVYVDGSSKSQPQTPQVSVDQQLKEQGKAHTEQLKKLRDAANRGDVDAMNALGVGYANGQPGFPIDHLQALAWFKKSADAGNAYGQAYASFLLLQDRHGVPVDNEAGFRLAEKSAKQGHPMGQNNLGWCYENGRGVSRNVDEAVYWYKKAASNGNQMAANHLKRLGK